MACGIACFVMCGGHETIAYMVWRYPKLSAAQQAAVLPQVQADALKWFQESLLVTLIALGCTFLPWATNIFKEPASVTTVAVKETAAKAAPEAAPKEQRHVPARSVGIDGKNHSFAVSHGGMLAGLLVVDKRPQYDTHDVALTDATL